MKLFILPLLVAIGSCAPRDKRLAVATLSISSRTGGSSGCVVTGKTLYANGIKQRDLNTQELAELDDYVKKQEQFREEVKAVVESSKPFQFTRQRSTQSPRDNSVRTELDNSNTQDNLPEPPARPSFCPEELTTQYNFEGCMVQNNKVYVGGAYARDLSSAEVDELKQFDKEHTAYVEYMTEQMKSKFDNMFGSRSGFLSEFFGDETATARTTTATSTATAAPPKKPEIPNFCTQI